MTDIRLYWLWLQRRLGVGDRRIAGLLRDFEHPRRIYEADEETLRQKGVGGSLLSALADKSLDEAQRIYEATLAKDIWLMTPDAPYYPRALLSLPDLPAVLYGKGDCPSDWDRRLAIAVVGTRKISDAGRRMTAAFTAGLCAGGAAVVTGVAPGSDETVMEMAASCRGLCVAVMAGGLDTGYPQHTYAARQRLLEHGGVLLSEYAPGEQGGKGCYHARNRLLSGLCAGTLLTEAPVGSGALITGRWAREQGRDVFVLPGDLIQNEGGHQMVREGALLVTSSTQILEEYQSRYWDLPDRSEALAAEQDMLRRTAPPAPSQAPAVRVRVRADKPKKQPEKPAVETAPSPRPPMPGGLTREAQQVFELLGDTPQPQDALSAQSGLASGAVLAALTELEMTGRVQNLPGGNYRLKG